MVVCGAGHVARAFDLGLGGEHARGREEQRRRGRRAQREVEAAVGPDCDARGDRGARVVVRSAGVELLG